MLISIVLSVLVAVNAPTLGVPNNPNGSTQSAVQLEGCRLETDGNPLLARTGKLVIQFANEGAMEADLVRFSVRYNGTDFFIRDVGKFSPGIEIRHKFDDLSGRYVFLAKTPLVDCAIDSVHFADGSVWSRPAAKPVGAAAPTPSPSPTSK